LSARVEVASGIAWLSSAGVAHQRPGLVVPTPAMANLAAYGQVEGVQTSYQASQGVELALPWSLTVSTSAFLHRYDGLADVTAFCMPQPTACFLPRVSGTAYGLEMLVKRPMTKRLTGWISYTLSRSTREAHVLTVLDPSQGSPLQSLTTMPSDYDRTHVLSALASYDLGRGWRVGARAFFYTGRPYMRTSLGLPVAPYNAERMPSFTRFDVRLEKSWGLGATGKISFVAEGLNVTLQKEVTDVNCSQRPNEAPGQMDSCVEERVGPITIPNVGLEAIF
jgi:hypothetical protein